MFEEIEPFAWYAKRKAKKNTRRLHAGFAKGLVKGEEYEDFLEEEPEEDEFFEIIEKQPLYREEQIKELISKEK